MLSDMVLFFMRTVQCFVYRSLSFEKHMVSAKALHRPLRSDDTVFFITTGRDYEKYIGNF